MGDQTRETAAAIASQVVADMATKANAEFELMFDRTVEIESGWIFFYNSTEFVRTKNILAQLAGNGPIYVGRDGEVIRLPSHTQWRDVLSKTGRV